MSVIVELGKKRAWIHSKLKIVSFHEIDGWNLFPVMFFYMITSNNRKQDEQALIREQQAIEEANIYDEKNNINIMRLINISPKKYNSILSCYLYEKRCLQ